PHYVASPADYDAAARVMPKQLSASIRNSHPILHWIGTGHWAWYKSETEAGIEYILIDAATGQKQAAFDKAAVAAALARDGEPTSPDDLPVADLVFSEDRAKVKVVTPKRVLEWN